MAYKQRSRWTRKHRTSEEGVAHNICSGATMMRTTTGRIVHAPVIALAHRPAFPCAISHTHSPPSQMSTRMYITLYPPFELRDGLWSA
eukprot:27690-Eustigmatos_ZCMA.PRE.1